MRLIIIGVIFTIILLYAILPIDERSASIKCIDPDGKLDECITNEMYKGVSHRLAVDTCTDNKKQKECFDKFKININKI